MQELTSRETRMKILRSPMMRISEPEVPPQVAEVEPEVETMMKVATMAMEVAAEEVRRLPPVQLPLQCRPSMAGNNRSPPLA